MWICLGLFPFAEADKADQPGTQEPDSARNGSGKTDYRGLRAESSEGNRPSLHRMRSALPAYARSTAEDLPPPGTCWPGWCNTSAPKISGSTELYASLRQSTIYPPWSWCYYPNRYFFPFNDGETMRTCRLLILFLVIALPTFSQAGWLDTFKKAGEEHLQNDTADTSGTSSITTNEAIRGLKAALDKAVGISIDSLGQTDGFLGNDKVKIPMPDSLRKVETTLRLVGQDQMADDFVTSMNRAAEQAVPFTKDAFMTAIRQMTFKDAMDILKGSDTAATEYFQRVMSPDLKVKVEPIVSEAMDSVDVTQYYKTMTNAARLAGIKSAATDLDGYVTDMALDGLFYTMGQEEKNIRENPVARTSDILKKVFGSI